MFKSSLLALVCVLGVACSGQERATEATLPVLTSGDKSEPAEVVEVEVMAEPIAAPPPVDVLHTTQWPEASLESGQAFISCERKPSDKGTRVESLDFFAMVDVMTSCKDSGLVHLRYDGRIRSGFTDLVARTAAMADRMGIDQRILEINSAGGHVEEAIKAGDAMGSGGWTVVLHEEAACHSACVLVLAAGDMRDVKGKVGIHRLMRDHSKATSRAELSAELREINAEVRHYLERHGVALAVSDLMMTVPNRQLRVLTPSELELYGLQGANAAQDDLDRILVMRKCGEEFIRRRDAFTRAYESQCEAPDSAIEDLNRCGLELRSRFGFPDERCPAESPLAGIKMPGDAQAAARATKKDSTSG